MIDAADSGFESVPVEPTPSETALQGALNDLLDEASGKTPTASDKAASKPAAIGALERRAHMRFAFKVMCAVLASYATYTLLDWPGIRTAITTCFFVSLTTVGESVHKLTLRLSGAIIGGLIAGLCIVFVLPSLTDIGQLCLLIAAVSTFCAWISTASETIAYGGMQIAFAFFLGVLQGYGPTEELTVLRDRVAGIVVGNLWITVFFTTLWPVSALDQARAKWAAAIGQLGGLLTTKDAADIASMKAEICKKIAEGAALKARSIFEWKPSDRLDAEARQVEQLTSAVFVVLRLKESAVTSSRDEEVDQIASQRLIALSHGTRSDVSDRHVGPAPSTLLGQARQQLNEEIDHASRAI
jgi:multidrug resistance protein MdtO